jgi:hypothetical protein
MIVLVVIEMFWLDGFLVYLQSNRVAFGVMDEMCCYLAIAVVLAVKAALALGQSTNPIINGNHV